jgi:hypothetical protein
VVAHRYLFGPQAAVASRGLVATLTWRDVEREIIATA